MLLVIDNYTLRRVKSYHFVLATTCSLFFFSNAFYLSFFHLFILCILIFKLVPSFLPSLVKALLDSMLVPLHFQSHPSIMVFFLPSLFALFLLLMLCIFRSCFHLSSPPLPCSSCRPLIYYKFMLTRLPTSPFAPENPSTESPAQFPPNPTSICRPHPTRTACP